MKRLNLEKEKWVKKYTYEKVMGFEGLLKGAVFQVIRFGSDEKLKSHHHNKTTEIYVVLEGEGTLVVNSKFYPLRALDIYLIEPNDKHGIINGKYLNLTIAIFKLKNYKHDIYWED